MKYTFHIVDVFSSAPFGGVQLAVLPDAAGISPEGMQKIACEFNFGATTFVLPKKVPANMCRVRIFTPHEFHSPWPCRNGNEPRGVRTWR